MLIPIVMHVKWLLTTHRNQVSWTSAAEWVLIALELVVTMVIMTLGTADALKLIFLDFSEGGAPFACHCQHLWNTCSCSPGNPALKDLCPREMFSLEDRRHALPFMDAPPLHAFREGMWWY